VDGDTGITGSTGITNIVRYAQLACTAPDGATEIADNIAYFTVPSGLNGMNLVYIRAFVVTAGTTNATTIEVYNLTDTTQMLSADLSIPSGGQWNTSGTINTSADDVVTDDIIVINVTAISTTPAQGLIVTLGFQ